MNLFQSSSVSKKLSAYDIGAGIQHRRGAGKDMTQSDTQGNARQMPMWERGLRVTGGFLGARQTINTEIATPKFAVNKLNDIFKNPPTIKPQGDFVTPEGFRINRNIFEKPLQTVDDLTLEMRGDHRINIRSGDGRAGSGFDYAWRRHGGRGNPVNKSQFTVSKEEVKALLQQKDVIKTPAVEDSQSGNYFRQVDVGKVIGRTPLQKGGHLTSVITIITDEVGNLVNVFPGNKSYGATLTK